MIWLVLIALLAATLVFVMPALLRPSPVTAREALTRELAQSKIQLAQIEAEIASGFLDEEGAKRAKRAMERRILKLGDRLDELETTGKDVSLPMWVKAGVPAVVVVFALGLYPLIGAPFFDLALKQAEEQSETGIPPLPVLEAQLLQRLGQDPDPVGFVYLGRVRMDMGKYDQALEAYEAALSASGNNPDIAAEYQMARNYIAQQNGAPQGPNSAAPDISDEARDAMAALTPEQRQAQIAAMVDGLAARLSENPDDLQGWLRLIRARTVMGDTEAAQASLTAAEAVFADDEEAQASLASLAAELGLPQSP